MQVHLKTKRRCIVEIILQIFSDEVVEKTEKQDIEITKNGKAHTECSKISRPLSEIYKFSRRQNMSKALF